MPDKLLEMLFPAKGIDLTCEAERQTPGTTPLGRNVRAFEPGKGRMRGGSRPALSRWIDDQVNGSNVIQHLAVIVDPQATAIASDDGTDAADSVAANRNTIGGFGGYPPVRHRHQPGRTYVAIQNGYLFSFGGAGANDPGTTSSLSVTITFNGDVLGTISVPILPATQNLFRQSVHVIPGPATNTIKMDWGKSVTPDFAGTANYVFGWYVQPVVNGVIGPDLAGFDDTQSDANASGSYTHTITPVGP